MVSWPVPATGYIFPVSLRVQTSQQFLKGALLWENNGVREAKRRCPVEMQDCVSANQGSSEQLRMHGCPGGVACVSIQGLPRYFRHWPRGSSVLVSISWFSKIISIASYCDFISHGHC